MDKKGQEQAKLCAAIASTPFFYRFQSRIR